MTSKLRVAIIFDNAGHPTQPFLIEWFNRISKTKEVDIVGFTDRFYNKPIAGMVSLKTISRVEKLKRRVLSKIKLASHKNLDLPFHLWPLANFNPHIIHLLNAQQIDQYDCLLNEKRKLMVSFRGFETSVRPAQDAKWSIRLKKLYHQADRLHMVSDFLKNEAIEKGAAPDKCKVIRRAVETRFFKSIERNENISVSILAVGRLTWQKGYTDLLKAFSKVNNSFSCTLTIVGSGEDFNKIVSLIEELHLRHFVTLINELNRTDLLKTYQQADIFVQASVSDALPNVVLEACACSLPVVGTVVGGIPEIVKDGISGILIQPGDVEALAEAMESLIRNKNFRSKLGRFGREFMEKEFSTDKEVEKWVSVYASM